MKPERPESKKERRPQRTSMARGSKPWRPVFLAALAKSPIVSHALDVAQISSSAAYESRQKSAVFARQWDKAIERGYDRLKRAIYERAVEGVPEPVWMKDADGKPIKVDEVRKYSDGLAMFLLKQRDPSFRDTVRNEMVGVAGAPPIENVVTLKYAGPDGQPVDPEEMPR